MIRGRRLSAVVEKQFYKIPKFYVAKGEDNVRDGFNKEVYDENGTSTVFTPAVIYYSDDDFSRRPCRWRRRFS